ncbi:DUF5719 family protein [Citricoccus sp.]|uniref:DUF5719 family protein n=1 Tax=Citricoccus sp. TaxID=1978372 RepID=UPI002CF34E58|nr:DUF5719 family protein [Citricoccus sp.]HRO92591.1 DUF5719 family protein [Citricoccus sp.]
MNAFQHLHRPDDEPVSRGQRKTQQAAAARDQRRQAALHAHERGLGRRGRVSAGVAGAGVVLLVAGAVALGSLAAPVAPAVDGTAAPARLSAAPAQGVCPPPPRLARGAGDGTDTQFSPVSTTADSSLTSVLLSNLAGRFPGSTLRPLVPGASAGDGQETRRLTPRQPERVQQGEPATAGPDGVPVREASVEALGGADGEAAAVAVEPLGGQPAGADTVSAYSAADGDLAGTDATSCIPPAHEHWLTGAATTVGTTAVLVLSNPSASASTVDLSLYGAEGPVEAAGTAGIVLAPGQTRSLVLGGLAPGEQHLAVRVSAQGGAVGAFIQQNRLFGLVPGGVDVIQPTAAPAPRTVVPGVAVPGPRTVRGIAGQDGYEGVGPAVTIAAPSLAATAEVSVSGPDGPAELPGGGVVRVGAGSTVRVPLTGLDAGTYTVAVSADAPVTASAQGQSGTAGGPIDVSSVPAVRPLGVERVVALPSSATSTLALYAEQGGAVELTPVLADGSLGEPTVRRIGPATTRTVSAAGLADTGDTVSGVLLATVQGEVHAGVSVRTAQGISAYPVTPRVERSGGLPVRVGY